MSSLDPLWANGSYPRSPPFLLEVVQLVCLGGLKVLWAKSSYADVSLKRNVSVLMQLKKKKKQHKKGTNVKEMTTPVSACIEHTKSDIFTSFSL